jgi:hypothetical protein
LRFIHHPATAQSLNDCSWLAEAEARKALFETVESGDTGGRKTFWFLLFRKRNQPSVQPPAIEPGVRERSALYAFFCRTQALLNKNCFIGGIYGLAT